MKYTKVTREQARSKKPSAQEIKKGKRTPIYLILDNVRSMYNVGAMFRTADGALVEKMYLCGITAIPPRREISKTALEAETVVPWEYKESTLDAVKELKEKGVKIVALEITEPFAHYAEVDYEYPLALVVGHEIDGVSDEVLAEVDTVASIPMLGHVTSLNVATSSGIALYQLLYQYQKKNAKS